MTVKDLKSEEFDDFVSEGNTIVDFWAAWCGPCRIYKPIFHSAAESHKNVKFASVDVDSETEIAQRFGVMSIPTTLFFKDGKLIDRKVGVMDEDEIASSFQELF